MTVPSRVLGWLPPQPQLVSSHILTSLAGMFADAPSVISVRPSPLPYSPLGCYFFSGALETPSDMEYLTQGGVRGSLWKEAQRQELRMAKR